MHRFVLKIYPALVPSNLQTTKDWVLTDLLSILSNKGSDGWLASWTSSFVFEAAFLSALSATTATSRQNGNDMMDDVRR